MTRRRLSHTAYAIGQSALVVHAIPFLEEAGLPTAIAAGAISAMSVISVAGRIGFGYIGDQEMFLGQRSFPNPPAEGDEWTNEAGDMFKIVDGVITLVGRTDPPKKYW